MFSGSVHPARETFVQLYKIAKFVIYPLKRYKPTNTLVVRGPVSSHPRHAVKGRYPVTSVIPAKACIQLFPSYRSYLRRPVSSHPRHTGEGRYPVFSNTPWLPPNPVRGKLSAHSLSEMTGNAVQVIPLPFIPSLQGRGKNFRNQHIPPGEGKERFRDQYIPPGETFVKLYKIAKFVIYPLKRYKPTNTLVGTRAGIQSPPSCRQGQVSSHLRHTGEGLHPVIPVIPAKAGIQYFQILPGFPRIQSGGSSARTACPK
jgi:hypothetical protein